VASLVGHLDTAFRCSNSVGLHNNVDFGAGFLTAHFLAVYASHPSSHPVEWQDSLSACLLRLWPSWIFTNWISLKGFINSYLEFPLPKLCLARCCNAFGNTAGARYLGNLCAI